MTISQQILDQVLDFVRKFSISQSSELSYTARKITSSAIAKHLTHIKPNYIADALTILRSRGQLTYATNHGWRLAKPSIDLDLESNHDPDPDPHNGRFNADPDPDIGDR